MPDSVTPTTPATPAAPPEAGHMIPKARLDEVIGQREALKAQLDAIAAEKEAARQEQLKAAGQFGELEKELKAKLEAAEAEKARLAAIASEYEAQQTAAREAQIASLPESHRGIAASLAPDKLPEFVALVTGTKQTPPPKPGEPGAPPVVPPGRATPDEIAKGVREHGTQWLKDNASRIA